LTASALELVASVALRSDHRPGRSVLSSEKEWVMLF